jgi:hypothetical protein
MPMDSSCKNLGLHTTVRGFIGQMCFLNLSPSGFFDLEEMQGWLFGLLMYEKYRLNIIEIEYDFSLIE